MTTARKPNSTPDTRRHDVARAHYEAQLTEAKRHQHYAAMLTALRDEDR